MCLIVDVNVAHRILLAENDADFLEVRRRLLATSGRYVRLVYGGKLRDEYLQNGSIKRAVAALDRAVRTRVVPDDKISAEVAAIRGLNLCVSDDEHIIGLARASGVRVLCSGDQDLHADFGNIQLLSPRGRIYQNPSHVHLLRETCG